MSLLPTDPRAFLGADAVSYSELNTLASCETKWEYSYAKPKTEELVPSKAMALGSEVGRLWGRWWTGGAWENTENETALWLMKRYAEQYARFSMLWEMRTIEAPLVARFSWGPAFFGWADGLLFDEFQGELWIAELKTTADLKNVSYLVESNQMPLYVWAARQMGFPVVGAMLDVIRTHRPVRKELPLAESFDRRFLRFEEGQIERAIREAQAATGIRRQLLAGDRSPLRAVGPSCSWCPFVAPCQGLEVEILDEHDPIDDLVDRIHETTKRRAND